MIEALQKIAALSARVEALEVKEQKYRSLALIDGITAPATYSGFALIYVDTADGDLKIKFGDGTVKTIVIDT